jgi:hypothetical protein
VENTPAESFVDPGLACTCFQRNQARTDQANRHSNPTCQQSTIQHVTKQLIFVLFHLDFYQDWTIMATISSESKGSSSHVAEHQFSEDEVRKVFESYDADGELSLAVQSHQFDPCVDLPNSKLVVGVVTYFNPMHFPRPLQAMALSIVLSCSFSPSIWAA